MNINATFSISIAGTGSLVLDVELLIFVQKYTWARSYASCMLLPLHCVSSQKPASNPIQWLLYSIWIFYSFDHLQQFGTIGWLRQLKGKLSLDKLYTVLHLFWAEIENEEGNQAKYHTTMYRGH